jgi:hypothetical protein
VRDVNTDTSIGQLADITEGGLMLISRRPTPPDSTRHCRLNLLRRLFGRDYITFTAVCRWTAFNEETGVYHTGYEITDISPEDHSALRATLLLWKAEAPPSRKTTLH